MTSIGRSELKEQLRRWFQAEHLSEAEVDRLFKAWQARTGDRLYVNMLERQFDPANHAAEGRAWWEERQKGEHSLVVPITDADVINMWLTTDTDAAAPPPRPWCPEILAGKWRLVGVGKNRDGLAAPAAPREWTLHADGRLDAVGDPRHQGWTWCAHREMDLDLWLYPPDYPLPRVWSIRQIDGGAMRLHAADEPLGHMRWQRAP